MVPLYLPPAVERPALVERLRYGDLVRPLFIAGAQLAVLPGMPVALGGRGPDATVEYRTKGASASTPSNISLSGVDVGAADPNRVVVFCISTRTTVSGVTIGGVAATLVDSVLNTTNVYMYYAEVPSGSTADIDVTNPSDSGYYGYAVWRVVTTTPTPLAHSASTADPATFNTSTPAGSVAICYATVFQNTSSTFTNLTEDFDQPLDTNKSFHGASEAYATTATRSLELDYAVTRSEGGAVFGVWQK